MYLSPFVVFSINKREVYWFHTRRQWFSWYGALFSRVHVHKVSAWKTLESDNPFLYKKEDEKKTSVK